AGDLTLEPCTYPTEDGPYDADCGSLVVQESHGDPESTLIALPIIRVRARSSPPAEPVFFFEGGPGQTNLDFRYANRFARDHDFVFVGYRGVDGSVRLGCPEVVSALRSSDDFLAAASLRAYGGALRACAERFAAEGVDVRHYGIVQQIDDMEVARIAFGYERVNLLSHSAGTRAALIYGWRYPESVHRSVMVAVNPPGGFLMDVQATDALLERYADFCTSDAGCA